MPPPTSCLLVEHDLHAGERVGDRGDIGGQPTRRVLVGHHRALPSRTVEQRRHPAAGALRQRHVEPGLLGQPYAVGVGGQRGAADVGHLRQRRDRVQPDVGGARRGRPVLAALALQAGEVAAGVERRRAVRVRGRQRGPHRRQIGRGDQLVAAPADREAPHRAGELPVGVLEHLRRSSRSRRRPRRSDRALTTTFCASGAIGVRDLEIHRRLAARFARLSADHGRGELRQSVRGGERVEVGLVEAVEREEHDRGALAGEAAGGQLVDVVGGAAARRASAPCPARPAAGSTAATCDAACSPGSGRVRRPRRAAIRGSTAAAATRRTPARAGRGSRAPRRRMPSPPSRRRPRRRPSCRPVASAPPARCRRPSRTARRAGVESRSAAVSWVSAPVRRPEVGRAGQQVRVRSADQARVTGHRGAQVGDEHEHPDGDERQRAEMPGYHNRQRTSELARCGF